MTLAALDARASAHDASARHAMIVVVVGIIATTLAQPEVLGAIPIKNLLKNELHLGRAANAAFFFWIGLPWYIKPVAGVITDAFPLFGRRRSTYLLAATTLTVAAWIALAFTAHLYGPLFWGCMAISTSMVLASTVLGAFIVETAQAASEPGRFTAIRMMAMRACLIVSGPAAGYLASIAFGWTAAVCAAIAFLLIPTTLLFMREPRRSVSSAEILANAGGQLRQIAAARTMWAAAGFLALFYIAPGLTTALFYKQQNDLHMTTQGQGLLRMISGLGGVAAAVMYGWACRRIHLRRLLLISLTLSGALSLLYVFYQSVAAAQAITAIEAFSGAFAEIALMDLALRATPKGSEGLGYALMISVRNLAVFGTDWLGSAMMDTWKLSFNTLVYANSATTLIVVPLVFLLPAILVATPDAMLAQPRRP